MAGVTIFDDSTEGGALPESTPVSGSPCGCTSLCWAQTIAFLTFAFGNISLNEFNQWALSRDAVWGRPFPGFTFPIFYSMWHMSFSALAAYLLTCCGTRPALGLPSFAQLWRYKYGIVPLALCTGLSNWLNNKSFTLISLFLNQTLRAMGPLPTVVFEYVLVGKSYDGPVLACVALISAGSVMACLYHFQESNGLDGNAQWIGASICLVSVVLSALKPVIAMLLMAGSVETPRLDPAVVLFYDSGLAFCLLLLFWLVSGERQASLDYLADPSTRWIGIGIASGGATMAFVYNLATYYYVNLTSAVTSSVGANAVKITLIITSALQAHVRDVPSWTGVAIVIVSIAAYGYLTHTAEPSPPSSSGGGGGGGGGGAKEETPLKPQGGEEATSRTLEHEHDFMVLLSV